MFRNCIRILLLVIIGIQTTNAQNTIKRQNNETMTTVPRNESKSFMFTNSIGLFFCGETNLPNTTSYHGLSFLTNEYLEDYVLEIGNSILHRSQADAKLYSDSLSRFYEQFQILETVSISDSLPVLQVHINSKQRFPSSITPLISGSKKYSDYVVSWANDEKILYIAPKKQLVQNEKENIPVWVGISTYPASEFDNSGFSNLQDNYELYNDDVFIPGRLNFFLDENAYIFFIVAESKNDVVKFRNQAYRQLDLKIKKKEIQIEGIRKI